MQVLLSINFPSDIGWRPSFDVNGKFYLYLMDDCNWDASKFMATAATYNLLLCEIDNAFKSISLSE